jgi:class 3 adenylate cyclase
VKFKPVKLAPALIAVCVIVLICLVRLLHPDFFERLEWMTYDMRAREAVRFAPTVNTNLGFVFISDDTVDRISKGLLGKPYGLYWPRQIYGRLIRELANQGAKAVAFDIIFAERRLDHAAVPLSVARSPGAGQFLAALYPREAPVIYEDQGEKWLLMESDDFFAWQLKRTGIGVLAAEQGVRPSSLFATNALEVADISADRDPDGVLRRVKAFRVYRRWHPLFRKLENDPSYDVDLTRAYLDAGRIVLPRPGLDPIRIPVDASNNFDLSGFLGDKIPRGWPRKARAFTEERIWHMGIVLAAQELKLDLTNAEVKLDRGRIVLHGPNGSERVLPVDQEGYFYINWELPYGDSRITKEAMEDLLTQDMARSAGATNALANRWENKYVVVGSTTTGNDLTDHGATPLEKDTLLVSEHWNVANSVLTGRFVRRPALETDFLLIALMGTLGALLTWRLRALLAFLLVAISAIGYVVFANNWYVRDRLWLPIVLVVGSLLLTHVCLVTWRVVFEQAEKRRVKTIFSKIVSPNIVNELLQAETLSLGGARREVTVLFADVRGFTEFTDTSQERAATYAAGHTLTEAEIEACFDEQARETLLTVNTYLSLVADMVKRHDGTLDKYIGDCVMAFWGSPTPNPRHALACVRAAVDAQRAIFELNRERSEENRRRDQENLARAASGLAPRPLLPLLQLGSGINTGMVTVGLMGSEAHISNYTVFGREVNLASRLESLSGRGRVLISEATHRHLLRDDPALAATCVALPDANVKGFRLAVKVYEVPWRLPESASSSGPKTENPAPEARSQTGHA